MRKVLVVVPSDPLDAYKAKGTDRLLKEYFNPGNMFDDVYILSLFENGISNKYGATVIGVTRHTFKKELYSIKPSVVRAYGGKWSADLVCCYRLPGIPVVVSLHDARLSYIHPSVRTADIVLCTSKLVAKRAVQQGIKEERIHIKPNKLDLNIFKNSYSDSLRNYLRKELGEGKYLLHVGRKSWEKNLDSLIKGLSLLPDYYKCIFIGQGDDKPYRELALKLGVNDRCLWLKSIKNSDLPLWYSTCDCMCTPSRTEGFGVVFIEAAACGAAIVSTDIEPINDYLKNNVNSILIPNPNDYVGLSESIYKLCENKVFREKLKLAAKDVGRFFDKNNIDKIECDIYINAMQKEPLFRGGIFQSLILVKARSYIEIKRVYDKANVILLGLLKIFLRREARR